MQAYEIYNRLTANLEPEEDSQETNKLVDLTIRLSHVLLPTLSEEQKIMLIELENINNFLCASRFHDGILLGLKMSKNMRHFLEYPELVVQEVTSHQPPFWKRFEHELNFVNQAEKAHKEETPYISPVESDGPSLAGNQNEGW